MSYIAKSYVPSKKLVEAFLAMMQLMSLRQAWISDWEPNWKEASQKYGIVNDMNNIVVVSYYYTSTSLSFPTEEMAKDFMNTFKDLLEIAKPLI